jgi:predicted Zn-dependent protease
MTYSFDTPAPKSVRLLLAASAAVALALVSAGCQSGQIQNNVMNTAQENALGRDYASQIDSQAKFVMDGKINRRVLDIATPVFAQAEKEAPDVSFRIRIIDSPEVNAFSIPGGYVYIYRGLLDKIGSDDDALACIIGHESAHVVRRHVVKSISDSENKGFLVDLAALLSRSNAVSQAGGALFELDQLHYSRDAEYEADRWGERFAYNAGYDPTGMVRTFQTFEKMENGANNAPSYAQDHPINQNRILRVEEQLRELRADHGTYVSEAYDPNGDKIAAREHDLDYHMLVLSTSVPAPLPQSSVKTPPKAPSTPITVNHQ